MKRDGSDSVGPGSVQLRVVFVTSGKDREFADEIRSEVYRRFPSRNLEYREVEEIER